MDEWYYARQGRRLGPHAVEELRGLAAAGELHREDLVWKEGLAAWAPAGGIQALEGAFPGLPPEGGAPVADLAYSGYLVRAAARAIDLLLVGFPTGYVAGILAVVLLALLQAGGHVAAGWPARLQGGSVAALLCGMAGDVLYHSLCEGLHGATLGKLCCGLRVVSEDGGPSTMKGAVIRSLGGFLDFLFFGLVGLSKMSGSPRRQRYGDVWGKTAVVSAGCLPEASRRPGTVFLLAFALGVAGAVLVNAAGVLIKAL